MHRPGEIIDERYLLVKLLGIRAAAEMWEAEHEVVGRKVTLKFLAANLDSHPELHSVLVGEARAAVEIGHPTIVEVYDVGVSPAGEAYLVTEHLRGETLADLLARRSTLSPTDACHIARELLAGLEAAHQVGVTHGRLRPDAIVLRRERPDHLVLKILEFRVGTGAPHGLDTSIEGHEVDSATLEASMGRPTLGLKEPSQERPLGPYEAPEQALGSSDDPRSDLYAVGVMLREMLTGRPLAKGESESRTPGQASSEHGSAGATHDGHPATGYPPSDSDVKPSLPRDLEDVVRCATASMPVRRFATAREMAEALRSCANAQAPLAVPLRESVMPLLSTEARRSRGMARLERAVLGMDAEPRAKSSPARDNVVAMTPSRRPSTGAPSIAADTHVRSRSDERRAPLRAGTHVQSEGQMHASAHALGEIGPGATSLAAATAPEPLAAGEVRIPLPPPMPRAVQPPDPAQHAPRPSRRSRDPRALVHARRRPTTASRVAGRGAREAPRSAAIAPAHWSTMMLFLVSAVCVGIILARLFHL